MSERLTQITVIRNDANKFGNLQPGEISPVKDSTKPDLWIIACPICNTLGELRNHSITEHEDGTVTVAPSLVCNGSIFREPHVYERCTAHYFIVNNEIRWC